MYVYIVCSDFTIAYIVCRIHENIPEIFSSNVLDKMAHKNAVYNTVQNDIIILYTLLYQKTKQSILEMFLHQLNE